MEKADTGEFVSGVAGDYNSLLSAEMVKEINEICGRYPGSTKVVNGFAVWTPLLCLAVIQGLIAHSEFFCDTDFSRGLWKCASRNVFIARFILSRLNEVRGPKQIASYIQQLRASATQDWARKLSSRKPHSSKELDIPSWLSSFARPFPDGTLAYSPPEAFVSQPTLELNVVIDPAAAPRSFAEIFLSSDNPLQQRAFVHPTEGLGGLRLLSPCRLGYSWLEFFEDGQLLDDVEVSQEDMALFPQGSYNYDSDVVFWRYSIPALASSIREKIASRTGAWSIRHRVYILGLKDHKPFAELAYYFPPPIEPPAPVSEAEVNIVETVGRSPHLAGMNVFSVSSGTSTTVPVKSRKQRAFVAKSGETSHRAAQRRNTRVMNFEEESTPGIVDGQGNVKDGVQEAESASPYRLEELQGALGPAGGPSVPELPFTLVDLVADENQTKNAKRKAVTGQLTATANADSINDASCDGPRYSTSSYSSLAAWDKMPTTPKPTPSRTMEFSRPGSIGPRRSNRARCAPMPNNTTRLRLTLPRAAKYCSREVNPSYDCEDYAFYAYCSPALEERY